MIMQKNEPIDMGEMIRKHENFHVMVKMGTTAKIYDFLSKDYKDKAELRGDIEKMIKACNDTGTKYYLFCDDNEDETEGGASEKI